MDRCARQQHGVVLVLTLWTLTLITGFVAVGLTRSVGEVTIADRYLVAQQAFYAAEAGLEAMLLEEAQAGCGTFLTQTKTNAGTVTLLSFDPTMAGVNTSTGNYVVNVGDGTASVIAYQDPSNPDIVVIQSTGTAGGISRVLEAYVTASGQPLFRSAVLSDLGRIVMNGDASTDSYDSRNGAYSALTNRSANGDVSDQQSGVKIDLYNDAVINGDARAVNASGIRLHNRAMITGTSGPLTSPVAVPEIPVGCPAGAMPLGLSILSSGVVEKSAGTYCLGGKLKLTGGQLRFQGKSTLYVAALEMKGSAVLGPSSNKPPDLQVVTQNGGAEIYGKTKVYGTILSSGTVRVGDKGPDSNPSYDPPPTLFNGDSGQVFGAVIAKGKIVIGSGSCYASIAAREGNFDGDGKCAERTGPSYGAIHYDEALADSSSGAPMIEGGGTACEIKAWRQQQM